MWHYHLMAWRIVTFNTLGILRHVLWPHGQEMNTRPHDQNVWLVQEKANLLAQQKKLLPGKGFCQFFVSFQISVVEHTYLKNVKRMETSELYQYLKSKHSQQYWIVLLGCYSFETRIHYSAKEFLFLGGCIVEVQLWENSFNLTDWFCCNNTLLRSLVHK